MEQSRGGPKRIQSTTSFYTNVKKEITLIVSVGLVCTTGIGQGVVKFEVAHIRGSLFTSIQTLVAQSNLITD